MFITKQEEKLTKMNEEAIVKEDMICPATKEHCDDECCTVGSFCNIRAGELNGATEFKGYKLSEEFVERINKGESEVLPKQEKIKFTYLKQPPKKYTFEMPRLFTWTIQNCKPTKVLNLFAGATILFPKGKSEFIETRIDLNKDMPADYYMDAYEFVQLAKKEGWKYDSIIFDPPYNLRKSREKYLGVYTSELRKIKTLLPTITELGGVVLSYGYDSIGMGKTRGFDLNAVCLVCHGGDHNDTICIVETKVQENLNFE